MTRICLGFLLLLSPGFAAEPPKSTKVVQVSPRDKATDIDPRALLQIHFSNGLKLTTLSAESVRLIDSAGKSIPARLGSDIEGDVVTIQPMQPLVPRASYKIEVTEKLIDRNGNAVTPFRSSFTTGADRLPMPPKEGFCFTKTRVDNEHGPTAIAVGPDANIYVATYNGVLYRLRIDPKTGAALGKDKLLTLPGRKILGLTFDP